MFLIMSMVEDFKRKKIGKTVLQKKVEEEFEEWISETIVEIKAHWTHLNVDDLIGVKTDLLDFSKMYNSQNWNFLKLGLDLTKI